MFIRAVKKQRSKTSKVFHQFSLVQAARVDGKVKQRTILYLGSDKELIDKEDRKKVLEILRSKIFKQPDLFPQGVSEKLKNIASAYYDKYLLKYTDNQLDKVSTPPLPEKADYQQVDLEGLAMSDVKSFGAEHLCKQVLEKLKLKENLLATGMSKKQVTKALIAIASRAIFSSSEHKTAQLLKRNSSLPECYGIKPMSHKQLYRITDELYAHKEKIETVLYKQITRMFDIEDRLVIFDISNTYFETSKKGSHLAKFGRSKEKRSDCPIVVFTGVINKEGFIRHSSIYEGNKVDSATLADMIKNLSKHSDEKAKKTVVMDAGIATKENLALLRKKEYDYVCVSRKRLKNYPIDEKRQIIRETARGKQQVSLSTFRSKDEVDTWMYVQSDMKRKKENAMSDKLTQRFLEDLENIRNAFDKKGGTKKAEKVWERIGRIKERHSRVSGRYEIKLTQKKGKATGMTWEKKPNPTREDKEKGVYFIRTSYKDPTESELWDIYNTIREVESTFRCLKSALKIRPVHHQNDERVKAHIYLTVLAYQLVNTIRYMLKEKGMHYNWRNILQIMSTQTIQTVELPTKKKNIHLRKPSKPIKEVKQIYNATRCNETQKIVKKYVVYH